MSTIQEPPPALGEELPEPMAASRDAALAAEVRHELRRQGASIKATQRAFEIFAVLALVIAMASLLAVALKLDGKKTVVGRATPPAAAPPAAAAATPAALPHHVDVTLAQFAVSPSASKASA